MENKAHALMAGVFVLAVSALLAMFCGLAFPLVISLIYDSPRPSGRPRSTITTWGRYSFRWAWAA